MGKVNLSAFSKAVNECDPIVTDMNNCINSITSALQKLNVGLIVSCSPELYKTCCNLANDLQININSLKAVMDRIVEERKNTEGRLSQQTTLD